MFELKPLSQKGIAAALAKAERYRLLGEPWEAPGGSSRSIPLAEVKVKVSEV